MKDNAFRNKVNRDVGKTKKDLATLGDDGITGVSRIFEQMVDGAQKTLSVTIKTMNKAVGQGLSQYNDKLQDAADKVPGSFGEKAAGYPWVTITMTLVFGLLLGAFLKPGRQSAG